MGARHDSTDVETIDATIKFLAENPVGTQPAEQQPA